MYLCCLSSNTTSTFWCCPARLPDCSGFLWLWMCPPRCLRHWARADLASHWQAFQQVLRICPWPGLSLTLKKQNRFTYGPSRDLLCTRIKQSLPKAPTNRTEPLLLANLFQFVSFFPTMHCLALNIWWTFVSYRCCFILARAHYNHTPPNHWNLLSFL
jgi:hypothetical protein